MSNLREAAQQALVAMKSANHVNYSWACVEAVAVLEAALAEEALQRLTSVSQEIETALAEQEQESVNIGSEWTPCVKLPVTVHVRQQRFGETHVSTREGITPVKPDDLIMRGVSGEEYPIGREIFERTYQLGEAQPKAEPEQEPVEWLTGCPECGMDGGCDCPSGTWNPPQRKPLTINEVEQILAQHSYEIHGDRARYIVRMTEEAHGIGEKK